MSARPSALPLRLYYAAMFAALGAYLPYFPPWLEAQGVSGVAMSAVASLMPALGIVGPPLFGLVADALGLRGWVLRVACLGAALPFAAIAVLGAAGRPVGFPALLGLVAVYAFFRSPMTMMADVVALERTRDHGDTYGKTRLWGSIGFLGASLWVGARLDVTGAAALPGAIAAALFVSFGAALLLPGRAPVPPRPVARAARGLVAGRSYRLFLVVAFLSQVAHSAYDLCASLRLRDLGASGGFVGAWWAAGVACEIALMWASGRIFSGRRVPRLLSIGLIGAAGRWAAMAVVTSPTVLFALQPLHALSFGAVWLASVAHLRERVDPAVASTAQGLFTAAIGIGSVAGMFVWGPLYRARGGEAVFGAAAGVALVAVLASLAFARAARAEAENSRSASPQNTRPPPA